MMLSPLKIVIKKIKEKKAIGSGISMYKSSLTP